MTLKEFVDQIRKYDNILIFAHARPDGDTLGSAMAIKKAFENSNIKTEIVCASDIPEKYKKFKWFGEIKKPTEITNKYSAHLSVDVSVESMFGDSYSLYASCNNLFNLDHHISNSNYANYNYVENRAACCEIAYNFIKLCGYNITDEIANCLTLGILTDTGNFGHSNVTPETLEITSDLLKNGADMHGISYQMFKNQTKKRALLYGRVISKVKFFLEDKLSVISVFKEDFDATGASQDMTEGFIDFALSIEGVEVAISIMETKNNAYKISFRSKGKVNVNEIASVFGGGGHVLASGCMICGFYEDVKDKLIRAVSNQFEIEL